MTLDEALALLGSDRATDDATLRLRYRRLLRRHHPDVAGAEGATRTALLTQAWAVVERAGDRSPSATTPTPRTSAPAPPPPRPRAVDRDDVLPLPAPTMTVFNRLAEAADLLGDLSYIDRQNGILETVVRPEGGPSCSLMLTIRQQGADTLAECVLEPLEQREPPPIGDVVAALQRLYDELEAAGA